jgi:argininosuccinate lyase
VPFRETHHVAGAAVRLAETTKRRLSDLSVQDLKTLHPLFEEDVSSVWTYENSVEARNSAGGTSKRAVLDQVDKLKAWLVLQKAC